MAADFMALSLNSKENKNPLLITFLSLKDCGGFKGGREMSRFQVVTCAISANLLVLIFP